MKFRNKPELNITAEQVDCIVSVHSFFNNPQKVALWFKTEIDPRKGMQNKNDSNFWQNPFKPEDFAYLSGQEPDYVGTECVVRERKECAAAIANARFRELLEKHGKRVYGPSHESSYNHPDIQWEAWKTKDDDYTHTAILICEEEIKK